MSKKILIILVVVLAFTLSGCDNNYNKKVKEVEEFEISTIDVTKGDKLTYHLEIPYSDNERTMLESVTTTIFKYEFHTAQKDDGSCDVVSEKLITILDDEDTKINIFTRCVTSNEEQETITVLIIGDDVYFTDKALYNELEELLVY
jgi:uncharacterized lipoprotein NlpE involved in copper resistance